MQLLEAAGWAEVGPDGRRPMAVGTVFDVASLTKVTATLPVVLSLWASGALSLETPVAEVLPEFVADRDGERRPDGAGPDGDPDLVAARPKVTVEHLLTHTAGLPSHRSYWEKGLEGRALLARAATEPLEAPPGTRFLYSDIGFILLGEIAAVVGRRPLDTLVREVVTGPLGMARTGYGPRTGEDVAATEPGPGGSGRPGVVHDENAYALGGISGHAGLFSTAEDLARYVAAWTAPPPGWLPAPYLEAATADRTDGLGGHRGLGWTARHDPYDQLGNAWPATAVFHSGFTGTSLALDRPSGRWVVLLTNDVHFGRGRGVINPLRHAIHTALAPAAGG